jgi:hypothetical protein
MAARILFAFFLIFTTSCGFKAINYVKNDADENMKDRLASIIIKKSSGTNSQTLRTKIFETFNPANIEKESKYYLEISSSESEGATFVTDTGSTGRINLEIRIRYSLRSLKNNKLISNGVVYDSESYNINNNRYGNYTSKEHAREVVYKVLSEKLRNKIIQDLD